MPQTKWMFVARIPNMPCSVSLRTASARHPAPIRLHRVPYIELHALSCLHCWHAGRLTEKMSIQQTIKTPIASDRGALRSAVSAARTKHSVVTVHSRKATTCSKTTRNFYFSLGGLR
ncbi:hypothetical protein AMECASPLE_007849 [Ameca splendens]|uniref:Uncharacterized protein n=1 Tax=Ameca splendens TaxID=208324 RepID=A0ABV0XCU1_9TELE